MTNENYKVDYNGDVAHQTGGPAIPRAVDGGQGLQVMSKPKWTLPSILKTSATFLIAGAIFFSFEAFAPTSIRPSTLVGTYEARLHAAMKSAELQQQVKLDAYNASLKLANDQNLERYRVSSQAILNYYQADYDRTKIFAQTTANLQQQLTTTLLAQRQTAQATDMSVVNLTRLWGRFENFVAPGTGDGAMQYSDDLTRQLNQELVQTAQGGVTIKVDGWDTDLASPAEIQAELDRIKPVPLPEMPRFWEDTPQPRSNQEGQ